MAITRLSGGLTPADGSDPRTFPSIFNVAADEIEAVEGRVSTVEGDVSDLQAGFRFAGTRYYESDGSFLKADPLGTGDIELRAIRVRLVGGGAGGSSRDSEGGNGGGGGGAYAESFITDIAGLPSSVTVTRGAGGNGSAAGSANSTAGGNSSFGSLVLADGGERAAEGVTRSGGLPGTDGTGDIVIHGGNGGNGGGRLSDDIPGAYSLAGDGGDSHLGSGGRAGFHQAGGDIGTFGGVFGGGGGGSFHRGSTRHAGGDGANGIVIVDCFV